jgi:fatty-acyl-CoA synthase
MSLDQVVGRNIAQVIDFYGENSETRKRTFLLYRDDEDTLREVSFGEFREQSVRYGRMIQALRQEKGKSETPRFHVAFFMQNAPEVVYLLGGCAYSNSTLVGINNAQVGERLAHDINGMDIDVIFADEADQPRTGRTFLENLLEAHRRFGLAGIHPRHIIARQRQASDHPPGIATIEEKMANVSNDAFTPTPLDGDQAGVIIFTSGTTGSPKGIEVLWKKVFDVGAVSTSLLRYTEQDVGYVCMPLNHSNSLYLNLIPALLNGAKVMLRRRFSASNFVKDIRESRATVFNSVGDPVKYVLDAIGPEADYSDLPLRVVISTGTNAANRAAFSRIFGLENFAEAYGSTEVGALALVTPDTPQYSVGRVLTGKDVRVVNEVTGDACVPAVVDGEGSIRNFEQAVGELVVSQESLGASAFSGYYNLPAESAARLDAQGFYHMGDLGAIEETCGQRYVIFLGRTGTDRLRNKGENFSTTFVEEILARHPQVTGCAVIGIPYLDSTENDIPVFVIETAVPSGFDLTGFVEFCRRELPVYAQPGFLRLVTELPRTDTHKLKKAVLVHEFIERNSQRDADPNDLIYRLIEGAPEPFTSRHYQDFMAGCRNPAVRARFTAVTKRLGLFCGEIP